MATLAAFAVPAVVYIACASSEPGSWDTAELQGVPYVLGISHPTGFPFYTLLGYVWSHGIPLDSVAWRMNAMSGIAIGLTCAAACGIAFEFGAGITVALLASLWFAFSPNIWAHAVRAEAQDLALACEAIALYAFVRWLRGGGDAWFAAAFALCGLGMAAHPNALWILPALIVGAAIAPRRPARALCARSGALLAAALMLYAYLPLRSAYVVVHHLDPAAQLPRAAGGIFWNYNDPHTLRGLRLELTGSESETPKYLLASFNPAHFGTAAWTFFTTIRAEYDLGALLLVAIGFGVAWRRNWRVALVVGIACTAGLLFSVVYPNESDVGRYRMLASWLAVPLLGALTPQSRRGRALVWSGLLIVFLAVGASMSLERQRGFFDRVAGEGGRWIIGAVRPYVAPGNVVVTGWLDATSLAYGAYVDRSLAGRIVVSDDKLDMPLYRQWARQRLVFVVVDPRDVDALDGAIDVAALDRWHELYEVTP